VTVLVTTSGVAAIAAMSIARRRRRENSRTAAHVLGLNRMTSVPIWLGTAKAVDPGRGHRRIPVRAALVASTVGVTGVVAALAIDDAIDDTLANPGRAGQVSDIDVYPASVESVDAAFDPAWVERVRDAAGASARVAQFGRLATPIDGIGGVALTVKAGAGGQPPELALTVTEGKAPSGAGEVAVGPRTANDLDVAIGDTVRLDELGTSARVVGIALFPPEVHGGFDEGVWVAPVDFDGLARATDGGEAGVEQWLGVQVDGDLDTAVERIDTALGADGAASQVDPPLELDYLRNVERLPLMLAGFLAVLGALSLGHVLSTTIRRRTHEFAVLRALGLERRPTRLILNAQGTSIAVIGLAIGLPLGLAIGRRAWSWVSGAISIQDEAPVITTVLLLSLPVTLLVVNGLAVLPGRRLARMRLADELRAE
jgi:hypothetical protein